MESKVEMNGSINKRKRSVKNGVAELNTEPSLALSGSVSVIGRRRTMEDTLKVVHGFVAVVGKQYDFFGVYDGHGGARVASTCRDRMHLLLAKEVKEEGTRGDNGVVVVVDWEKAMRACFSKMDEEVRIGGGGGGGDLVKEGVGLEEKVGSTAAVVVVGKEEVVVANCGDSRAVLSRGGVAVPLSRDHKVKCLLVFVTRIRYYYNYPW